MAEDDFEVIVYKALSFLYECIKKGVDASAEEVKELTGCNDVYWNVVLESLRDDGLLTVYEYGYASDRCGLKIRITGDGMWHLLNDSDMKAASRSVGERYRAELLAAVQAVMDRDASARAMSADEFDRRFDDGEDITKYLDLSKGRHINRTPVED